MRQGFRSVGLVDPSQGPVAAPVGARDEIDARQHRCAEAHLRPTLLNRALEAMPEVRGARLTSAEAQAAGEAMFERWEKMLKLENTVPLLREDVGWAQLARAAWEAVWALRQAEVEGEHAGGEVHRP